jgi:tetratricopeptide (TPR) repeat protein
MLRLSIFNATIKTRSKFLITLLWTIVGIIIITILITARIQIRKHHIVIPGYYAYSLCSQAEVLINENRTEEAVSSLQLAIKINPDDSRAYIIMGNAMRSMGKYQDALIYYEKAEKIDPNNYIIYNNIGFIMYTAGRYDEAIKNYETSVKRCPNRVAYYNLSILLKMMQRNNEAIEAHRKALAFEHIQ